MKIVLIQNKILPADWLNQIRQFDIDASSLPSSLKPLCRILKENICAEEENSIMSYFNQPFVCHVCLGDDWEIDEYEDIPLEHIEEIFKEMGSERGIQYDQKLSSLFSEVFAYKYLCSKGYHINSLQRTSGSCDLVLKKDDKEYHCEVKVKSNDDAFSKKIMFYLRGKSYLASYTSLHGLEKVYYKVKRYPSGYQEMKELNRELNSFCEDPIYYDGEYIIISREKDQVLFDTSDYVVSSFSEAATSELLENILIGEGRHLTNMIEKAINFPNFIGYLHLSLPFDIEISIDDIENWLNLQCLDFDLYVSVSGIGIESEVLHISKTV